VLNYINQWTHNCHNCVSVFGCKRKMIFFGLPYPEWFITLSQLFLRRTFIQIFFRITLSRLFFQITLSRLFFRITLSRFFSNYFIQIFFELPYLDFFSNYFIRIFFQIIFPDCFFRITLSTLIYSNGTCDKEWIRCIGYW
jgi:hypothetical protein